MPCFISPTSAARAATTGRRLRRSSNLRTVPSAVSQGGMGALPRRTHCSEGQRNLAEFGRGIWSREAHHSERAVGPPSRPSRSRSCTRASCGRMIPRGIDARPCRSGAPSPARRGARTTPSTSPPGKRYLLPQTKTLERQGHTIKRNVENVPVVLETLSDDASPPKGSPYSSLYVSLRLRNTRHSVWMTSSNRFVCRIRSKTRLK